MAFALAFWAFFGATPTAQAGFWDFLGDPAEAQTTPTPTPSIIEGSNSQTIALLETSGVSPVFKEKDTKKSEQAPLDASSEVNISNNALVPSATPVSGIGGIEEWRAGDDDISVYVVRKGDTVAQVAEMFGITPDTILSANDMKKGDKLKEGDVLLILPFSGVEHTVAKSDTIQSIAKKYKVDADDILLANDLDSDSKLVIGDKLIIPGADMQTPAAPKASKNSSTPKSSYQNIANGYYTHPVPGSRRSRGPTKTHKGVDMAAPTGTPIHAAAGGRVTLARMGYNGGFGNMVVISHPNGTETLYAHMSRLGTSTGAYVDKGEVIGYVGSTGRSTGPHLHFEVHGAKNPF